MNYEIEMCTEFNIFEWLYDNRCIDPMSPTGFVGGLELSDAFSGDEGQRICATVSSKYTIYDTELEVKTNWVTDRASRLSGGVDQEAFLDGIVECYGDKIIPDHCLNKIPLQVGELVFCVASDKASVLTPTKKGDRINVGILNGDGRFPGQMTIETIVGSTTWEWTSWVDNNSPKIIGELFSNMKKYCKILSPELNAGDQIPTVYILGTKIKLHSVTYR